MKATNTTLNRLTMLSLVFVGLSFTASASASAQAALQNPGNNTLQPQSSQAQNTANTQNQVGTVQQNNSQGVLSQNGNLPLGVVSDPKQTTPDTVVQPSADLKTDFTKRSGSKTWLYILLSIVGLIALASFIIRLTADPTPSRATRTATTPHTKPIKSPQSEPITRHKSTKKKQTRRRRRKSSTK